MHADVPAQDPDPPEPERRLQLRWGLVGHVHDDITDAMPDLSQMEQDVRDLLGHIEAQKSIAQIDRSGAQWNQKNERRTP